MLKRNMMWNTIGSTAYFAAQWLVTFLVLRIGGLDASGLLSTAMTVTNVFISFAGYGMRYYQVSDTKGEFSNAAYVKSRFLTCIGAGVFCFVFTLAVSYTTPQRICILLWLLYRMSEPFSDVYNGISQHHERLYEVGISYTFRAAFTLIPFVLLLALTKNLYLTLFVMAVLVWCTVFFYDMPKARACAKSLDGFKGGGNGVWLLLCACAPLALYKLLETAAASIPKFFLERALGNDAIAVYAPATSPVLLLQTGASFLLVPLVTVFAKALEEKDKKAFIGLFKRVGILLFALLPVGILICITMGRFGLSVISPQLAEYDFLLIPMVFAATLTSGVMFLSMLLTVMRALKALIIANLAGLVTAAVLSVPLINTFNLNGTTYALCAALVVQGCIMLVALIKGSRVFND